MGYNAIGKSVPGCNGVHQCAGMVMESTGVQYKGVRQCPVQWSPAVCDAMTGMVMESAGVEYDGVQQYAMQRWS